MMKKQWKGFVAGILSAALIAVMVTPGLAALAGKTIQVFTGVDIYIDDVKLNPKDANGNPVEVFVYNGTTYLPVRAVGEAVGKTVQWEGKTNSVYLGKHTGEKPAVWLKDLDYFTGMQFSTEATEKDNLGNMKENVILNKGTQGSTYNNVYKLNGQYSKISGTLFQRYNFRSWDYGKAKLEIYGDGKLLYSAIMGSGVEPIEFSVDLRGVLELKVYFDTYAAAIADCGLWT